MITKDKFLAYVKVQNSSRTNMFIVNNVIALSGGKLSREDISDIMVNYEEYERLFSE